MDDNDFIVLKIPTAREKLLQSFPSDQSRGDIKIIFKSKVFNLCKAYLRLESSYFKKVCTQTCNVLDIKQNFNEEIFEKVLSCFYGASVQMERSEVGNFYPVIRFLEIDSLLNFIRNDILLFIDHYDLFVIMKIAHTYSDQEIFIACLQQLQKQSFQQLKYHQFELLQTQLSLFKLVIKTHSRHRSEGKPGIPYTEIDQIIRDYCENKGMVEDAYRALKFELIDKTALTAQQYKEIFLDQVIKMKNKVSTYSSQFPVGQSIIVGGQTGNMRLETNNLAESVISPVIYGMQQNPMVSANLPNNQMRNSMLNGGFMVNGVNELSLEMQNTFQKKTNQELTNENRMLEESLHKLKQITEQNQKIHEQMENQLRSLKEQLKKKQNLQRQHKQTISIFEVKIRKMQKQLQKKTQDIDSLVTQFEQLSRRKPLSPEQETEQENMIAVSQFLPAHIINQMMNDNPPSVSKPKQNPKKQPKQQQQIKYEQMDEEDLEELYLPRITFDVEPISTPKYNLPKLCKFITNQGFSKHQLNLIYRRSLSQPPKGTSNDIRQKENILILINTVSGQNIGGFVSVPIPKNQIDYIEDPGAFLFTLTKNKKLPIKKSEVSEAIFMSQSYLISFANDLMIASDCLKQKSECSWPSSYEGIKTIKERGPVWLVGENQFLIKDVQIYEMTEQEMEMIL